MCIGGSLPAGNVEAKDNIYTFTISTLEGIIYLQTRTIIGKAFIQTQLDKITTFGDASKQTTADKKVYLNGYIVQQISGQTHPVFKCKSGYKATYLSNYATWFRISIQNDLAAKYKSSFKLW